MCQEILTRFEIPNRLKIMKFKISALETEYVTVEKI